MLVPASFTLATSSFDSKIFFRFCVSVESDKFSIACLMLLRWFIINNLLLILLEDGRFIPALTMPVG